MSSQFPMPMYVPLSLRPVSNRVQELHVYGPKDFVQQVVAHIDRQGTHP